MKLGLVFKRVLCIFSVFMLMTSCVIAEESMSNNALKADAAEKILSQLIEMYSGYAGERFSVGLEVNYESLVDMDATQQIVEQTNGWVLEGWNSCVAAEAEMSGDDFYPKQWKALLVMNIFEEDVDYAVKMYAMENDHEVYLYHVSIGDFGRSPIGIIRMDEAFVKLGISYGDIPVDVFSEESMNAMYAIQEDANIVLDILEDVYEIEKGVKLDESIETTEISTMYGTLHYPAKWDRYSEVNMYEQDKFCMVQFYAVIGEEKIPLFDVCFGDADGICVGKVLNSNDEYINVFINMYEAEYKDGWTQDEYMIYESMREDVNLTIVRLQEIEKYSRVN